MATNLAPGSYVTISTASPSSNTSAPTGTWFVTGQTQLGPVGTAIPLTSMNDYANFLGTRVSYGFLYDSLNEFFQDGGVLAYVSRVTGPASADATVTLEDRQVGDPAPTLVVSASGPGAWGNNLSVVVANGSVDGSYTIQVLNSGEVVLTSPNLFSPSDAVDWFSAQNSWVALITITNSGDTASSPNNNPAAGTFSLTGGSDDISGVTETQWTNALAAFTDELGPGQVSAPGHSTSAGYIALDAHAVAFNRYALLDPVDSDSASNLVGQAQSAQASLDPSYSAMFAPWVIIPGITSVPSGSSSPIVQRIVPPSALAAALFARSDSVTGNTANVAAAGNNGQSNYAINITQTYNDTDRGTLNSAGVNVIRVIQNVVTLYGDVSLSLDPNWGVLSNARFRMQVVNDFNNIAEGFVFQQIDGKGQLFSTFNGALSAECNTYWIDGSLYGASATDAYFVNTGPQVNTPQTIAAQQLNAVVSLRMSPAAQFVNVAVVKYLSNQTLPSATA